MDPKFIKNLAGILSIIFAICLLISSGFLLSKVLPLYNTTDVVGPSGIGSNPGSVTSGNSRTKNSTILPPSRTSIRDLLEANANTKVDPNDPFRPFDDDISSPNKITGGNKSTVLDDKKILLNVDSAVEEVLGDVVGRRKRDTSKMLTKLTVEITMDTICLDEWSRFIGLAVGGIVLSLAQIFVSFCQFWKLGKNYPTNLPLTPSSILMLIKMILDVILWLLTGLSLYSSHCVRSDFVKEKNLFSFFLAMDATILFVTLTLINLTKEKNHHHNKFYDDDEVEEGSFPGNCSQRLRLQTTP